MSEASFPQAFESFSELIDQLSVDERKQHDILLSLQDKHSNSRERHMHLLGLTDDILIITAPRKARSLFLHELGKTCNLPSPARGRSCNTIMIKLYDGECFPVAEMNPALSLAGASQNRSTSADPLRGALVASSSARDASSPASTRADDSYDSSRSLKLLNGQRFIATKIYVGRKA